MMSALLSLVVLALIGTYTLVCWLRDSSPKITCWIMRLFGHGVEICPTCNGDGFVTTPQVAALVALTGDGRYCECGVLWRDFNRETGQLICANGHKFPRRPQ